MLNIGNKVKELREARGWTQEQLAEKSGLSRGYISILELRHGATPNARRLKQLADAFKVDLGVFLPELKSGAARPESPEDLLARYLSTAPVSIPIYASFQKDNSSQLPIMYTYRQKDPGAVGPLEGVPVDPKSFAIEGSTSAFAVIDRGGIPEVGDHVICLHGNHTFISKVFCCMDSEKYTLENDKRMPLDDCEAWAVILGIYFRMK